MTCFHQETRIHFGLKLFRTGRGYNLWNLNWSEWLRRRLNFLEIANFQEATFVVVPQKQIKALRKGFFFLFDILKISSKNVHLKSPNLKKRNICMLDTHVYINPPEKTDNFKIFMNLQHFENSGKIGVCLHEM